MRNLSELKGQPIARRLLENRLRSGPPPLMVFVGPSGVGKWSAAETFIQHCFCEVGTACGNCLPCRKLLHNNHADFIRFPEEKILIGEPENPASFTIRWLLQTRIPYSPFDGPLRFVLFPAGHLIQHEAETALLKTLEEPPDHTRFILLAHDTGELKETILSRATLVPFRHLSGETLAQLVDSSLTSAQQELLGGSLDLVPLFGTEFFEQLESLVAAGLKHPGALLELEQWLKGGERGAFQDLLPESDRRDYLDLLDFVALYLLQQTRDKYRRLAFSLFEFKRVLRVEGGTVTATALSRLFHDIEISLFGQQARARML